MVMKKSPSQQAISNRNRRVLRTASSHSNSKERQFYQNCRSKFHVDNDTDYRESKKIIVNTMKHCLNETDQKMEVVGVSKLREEVDAIRSRKIP